MIVSFCDGVQVFNFAIARSERNLGTWQPSMNFGGQSGGLSNDERTRACIITSGADLTGLLRYARNDKRG